MQNTCYSDITSYADAVAPLAWDGPLCTSICWHAFLPFGSDTHTSHQLPVRWHTQGLHAYAFSQTSRHSALPVSKPIQIGSSAACGRTYAVLKLSRASNLCWLNLAVMQSSGQLLSANAGQSMHRPPAMRKNVYLAKLEHLDINGFLLQLGQLVLGGGLVLEQLHMLMLQLPLCCLQACPLLCQLLQRTPGLHLSIIGLLYMAYANGCRHNIHSCRS